MGEDSLYFARHLPGRPGVQVYHLGGWLAWTTGMAVFAGACIGEGAYVAGCLAAAATAGLIAAGLAGQPWRSR